MNKIVVIGSVNIDYTIVTDKFPEVGETVLSNKLMYNYGGKGANQAVAASKLTDGKVQMIGMVGNDDNAKKAIKNFITAGVDTSKLHECNDTLTGCAFVNVSQKDNTIIVVPGANEKVNINYINGCIDSIKAADIVMLQNEIPQSTIEYVMDICNKNSIKVIYNPAPFKDIKHSLLKKSTYITPNHIEFKQLLKKWPELDKSKFIVTNGKDGAYYFGNDGKKKDVPGYTVAVVDTTGAGDTFNAAFAVAMSKEVDMDIAIDFANKCASISTTGLGAQASMPSLKQLKEVDIKWLKE